MEDRDEDDAITVDKDEYMDHDDMLRLLRAMKAEVYGHPGEITTSSTSSCELQCPTCCNNDKDESWQAKIILEDGNFVCKGCNTLLDRFLDSSAEWHIASSKDDGRKVLDMARCGPPPDDLLPSSAGSILTATGSQRGSIGSLMISKYQLWHAQSYRERTLRTVFELLAIISLKYGLPNIILEEAKHLFKKISELRINRGENRRAIIAACIYMACKTNRVPRCIKEIAEMFGIKTCSVTKAAKEFEDVVETSKVLLSRPVDFVNRFCTNLGASPELLTLCQKVVKNIMDQGLLTVYAPTSAAAGCIMVAVEHLRVPYSKKDVATACHVSVVTINKCLRTLRGHREKVVQ